MKLSIIIPTWNDFDNLKRLLAQIDKMAIFHEAIIVDDASDIDCSPKALGLVPSRMTCNVIYLRNDHTNGAGYSRNRGIEKVSGDHVIFFDSDDLFTDEFPLLLDDLEDATEPYDFCIFKHVDSRARDVGSWAPLEPDVAYWNKAGIWSALQELPNKHFSTMVQIANYPWNKIYTTAFLIEKKLRCTELMVQNDVELHWLSFLRAERILVSNRVGCEHFVVDNGIRLTNRNGHERLEIFRALVAVHKEIKSKATLDFPFLLAFTRFHVDLISWINTILNDDMKPKFQQRVRAFLTYALAPEEFEKIIKADFDVGFKFNEHLGRGLK